MIAGTTAAWIDAIQSKGIWYEEADAPRFREAFAVLARNCTRWPSPAMFFQVLPSRAETDALMLASKSTLTDEQRKKNVDRLHALVQGLVDTWETTEAK
jgi:hypothetical protein